MIAFECSPLNFKPLSAATQEVPNIVRVPVGLGRERDTLAFNQGADDLGATSRITDEGNGDHWVDIKRGADLVGSGAAPTPTAIKIDVEGFELEVLQGLGQHLMATSLHTVGIEVHFTLLSERDIPNAPQEIEAMLARSGFNVSWPDASRIIATRHS